MGLHKIGLAVRAVQVHSAPVPEVMPPACRVRLQGIKPLASGRIQLVQCPTHQILRFIKAGRTGHE